MENPEVSTMQVEKRFISGNELVTLSRQLAKKIGGYRYCPDFIIGIWRGGALPSMCVQEYLQHKYGTKIDLVPIRTSSREDSTGTQKSVIEVHATGHARARIHRDTTVLIVDDVFDSGRTIKAVLDFFRERLGLDYPAEMQVATVFYKPKRKAVDIVPDFYVEETDEWLVFPHEQAGLSKEERRKQKRVMQDGERSALPIQEATVKELKQVYLSIEDYMKQEDENEFARTLLALYLKGMPWDARAYFSEYFKYQWSYTFTFHDTEYTIGLTSCSEDMYRERIHGSLCVHDFLWDYDLISDGPFEEAFEALKDGRPWRELAEAALKATAVGKE